MSTLAHTRSRWVGELHKRVAPPPKMQGWVTLVTSERDAIGRCYAILSAAHALNLYSPLDDGVRWLRSGFSEMSPLHSMEIERVVSLQARHLES